MQFKLNEVQIGLVFLSFPGVYLLFSLIVGAFTDKYVGSPSSLFFFFPPFLSPSLPHPTNDHTISWHPGWSMVYLCWTVDHRVVLFLRRSCTVHLREEVHNSNPFKNCSQFFALKFQLNSILWLTVVSLCFLGFGVALGLIPVFSEMLCIAK